MQNSSRRSLSQLIQKETGAPTTDLVQIQNIMREEIFHSTLDWQTYEQLAAAALQAAARLNENRDFYAFNLSNRIAIFNAMSAESESK